MTTNSEHDLYLINPEAVGKIWGEAGPMLARALERGDGNYTITDIFDCCVAGQMQLWAVYNDKGLTAAAVTMVNDFPQKRVLGIVLLAGGHRKAWWPYVETVLDWGRKQGCVAVEAYAREGLLKWLPDWRRCYVVIRRDLNGE